jgi:hypothetical protein
LHRVIHRKVCARILQNPDMLSTLTIPGVTWMTRLVTSALQKCQCPKSVAIIRRGQRLKLPSHPARSSIQIRLDLLLRAVGDGQQPRTAMRH